MYFCEWDLVAIEIDQIRICEWDLKLGGGALSNAEGSKLPR